ncbi:sugar phosphate isomerase/epimerase [Sphingomonas zeicaulis]|uniref:sugar phosphate isomerase/epimerase family protein n=1 Tax=Sphingomonas zeicaulis TaxID=1632740 RepID=UPI003D1AF185
MSPDALILSAGTVQAVPFLDRLAPARAAGFAGVSMFAADMETLAGQGVDAAEVRMRVADAGLFIHEVEIVGNWLPGTPTKPNPGWLEALLQRTTAAHVIAIAGAVGARGITVAELRGVACPPDEAAQAFAALCDRAADVGLHVALEFVPTGRIPDLATAWPIVEAAGRANGGLLVDSWHMFRGTPDLGLLASLPAWAIKSIQICDAPAEPEADLDHAMVHDRLLPGEGALDLAGFIVALRETGTSAPLGVEIFSDALAALPMAEIAARCAAAARRMIGETIDG